MNVFFALSLWFLTVPAHGEISFQQKLYIVFIDDSLVMTLNFSNPRIHQSYESFQLSVGNRSVITCGRINASLSPRCSLRNNNLFLFNNPVMKDNTMEIKVDNVTYELGDKILAVFNDATGTYDATTEVVVLDEPTCNSSYELQMKKQGPASRKTTYIIPIDEYTELNENTAVNVECSINSYHKSLKIPAFPSWRSTTAILLKMSNRLSYQRPLLSIQTATLVVNRISRFDSIHCEIKVPNCLADQAGCQFLPNVTGDPDEILEDHIDYDIDANDYEDDIMYIGEEDMAKTSMCLKNSKKCKCFLTSPKLTYCADEVAIDQEKLPNGSYKLTCRVQSSPPSNIVWESSDPSFKVSRETSIVVSKNVIYSCRASFPVNRDMQCEVRFKTIDLMSYAGADLIIQIIVGVALTVLGIFCFSSILFIIKGVVVYYKRGVKDYDFNTSDQNSDY